MREFHPAETSASFPGWRVLLACVVGLAFSPGPMIFGSLGLFAPHLQHAFGWGRGEIMLGLTFFNIAGVLASPPTGALIDRLGVRAILFPSLFFLLLGFLGLGYAVDSLTHFYVLAFAWGTLTVGTQSISYTKLITGWFERHRGLAVGIAAAGLGVGYSLIPLLADFLLSRLDWRQALAALAAVVVLIPVTVNVLLARPNPALKAESGISLPGIELAVARRTRSFALMAGAILLASAALTGVVPHIALLALDRGLASSDAAIVASTYGLSTIIGRILVGAIADRVFVPRVAMLFFGLSAFGFLLAAIFGGNASMVVLIVVALSIGLGFGAESDIIALFIARYFGQRSFGAIYGYLLAVFLVGAAAGPALFGFGRDLSGSYAAPMLAASAVMIVAIFLLSRLPPYPNPQAKAEPAAGLSAAAA